MGWNTLSELLESYHPDERFDLETPLKKFIETIEDEIDISKYLRNSLKNNAYSPEGSCSYLSTIKDLIFSLNTGPEWGPKNQKAINHILTGYGFPELAPMRFGVYSKLELVVDAHKKGRSKIEIDTSHFDLDTPIDVFIKTIEVETDISPRLRRRLTCHGFRKKGDPHYIGIIKDLILSYRHQYDWGKKSMKEINHILTKYGFPELAPKKRYAPLYQLDKN